jgi:hypothetical protein
MMVVTLEMFIYKLMSSSLPPGPVFLAKSLTKFSAPLVFVLAARCYIPNVLPKNVWSWAYFLAVPAVYLVRNVFQNIREAIEMRQLGARRPQAVSSWVPLHLDTLIAGARAFLYGYLCRSPVLFLYICLTNINKKAEQMQLWIDECGNTFRIQAMGRDTVSPIKESIF